MLTPREQEALLEVAAKVGAPTDADQEEIVAHIQEANVDFEQPGAEATKHHP